MLVVPFVCAEFHDAAGNTLYKIRPDQLRAIIEVPDSITQDPLYDMLIGDGSLRAPNNRAEVRQLENDPVQKAPKAEKSAKAEQASPAAPAESKEAKASDGKNTEKK